MRRRDFLASAASFAASAVLAERVLADPYVPARKPPLLPGPVRIRGRVTAAGRGLGRVGVTDGHVVVPTGPNGHFELVSTRGTGFVSVIPPAGHRLPVLPSGSLALHRSVLPNPRGEMAVSFALEPSPGDKRHAFLLLADPQTQDQAEMRRFHAETVPDVQAVVRGLDRPCFGVGCGDLMYDDLALFPEYERGLRSMGVPVAQVVGNHDLDQTARTDQDSVVTFGRHFGPNRYAFNLGRIHYVVLDDVFWFGSGYIGYLDADQLDWLAADLALVERGTPVVVFTHIPVWSSEGERRGARTPGNSVSVTNRQALYRLLEPFRARIFSGHMHEADHVFEGGVHEHTVGAVCGAWWTGDICYDGTPNGYGVYEVNGEELRWYYKATGQPVDHQLRVYPRGAEPTAPGEIVANVWNWDPEWKVEWYEGADRRGLMARRTGKDPLAVSRLIAANLAPRRRWIEPVLNHHMFYAPVGADAKNIRVVATDRFGQRYTAAVA